MGYAQKKEEEQPFPKPEVEQAYRAIESNTKEALELARQAIMSAYSPFREICSKRKMEISKLLTNERLFDKASGVRYGIEERLEKGGETKRYEVFSVRVEFEGIKRKITSEVGPDSMAVCLNQTGSDAKLLEMVSYGKSSGVEIFREGRA